MKNQFYILITITISLIVMACSGDKKTDDQVITNEKISLKDSDHTSKNSLDWAGTYKRILPCADCEGIETTIILSYEMGYKKSLKYIGKDEGVYSSEGKFEWNKAGNQITLLNEKDGPSKYFVGENKIIQLDMHGNIIKGDLSDEYILEKQITAEFDTPLVGTKWILKELRGKEVSFRSAGNKEIFLILRKENNRLHGYAGCNNFNGSYELKEHGRLNFSDNIAITMMACPDMELEAEFVKVLRIVDNYNLADNELFLNKARMSPLAKFVAEMNE